MKWAKWNMRGKALNNRLEYSTCVYGCPLTHNLNRIYSESLSMSVSKIKNTQCTVYKRFWNWMVFLDFNSHWLAHTAHLSTISYNLVQNEKIRFFSWAIFLWLIKKKRKKRVDRIGDGNLHHRWWFTSRSWVEALIMPKNSWKLFIKLYIKCDGVFTWESVGNANFSGITESSNGADQSCTHVAKCLVWFVFFFAFCILIWLWISLISLFRNV